MLKTNQRCNGMITSVHDKNEHAKPEIGIKYLYNTNKASQDDNNHINQCNVDLDKQHLNNQSFGIQEANPFPEIKKEADDTFQENIYSIIGIGHNNQEKLNATSNIRLKQNNNRSSSYHESLQRIGGIGICYNQYQQHWFSNSLERLKLEDKSREERLEITRYELRRHLKQILKSNLGKRDIHAEEIMKKSNSHIIPQHNSYSDYSKLVPSRICEIDHCKRQALPCTRHCALHIMNNTEQVLFDYCTAKFADNTQCSVPVFDITHELPLCPEHARKRDNYRMYQETKPKKLRKKVKPSAMIRPQKRNKKKKKPTKPPELVSSSKIENNAVIEEICEETPELVGDMVEEVLDLQEPDGLELVSVEQALVTQASNLLEESEINNVLSTIQADEFNDFFTVNRNGEYEPTREETEELERALAEVDNDVKSLEKLSQSQGLLDSFLDEHTLVESLVQIPDVFHNGYTTCGDNIVTQTSRLLSVEPHSQS